MSTASPRVAVVTPYFAEPVDKLRRCRDSVAGQTYPNLIHYCVADGFPQAVMSGAPGVRHIALPNAHGDYGNTPRGIGAICALNDGADLVCFLDADNLMLPEHVESVVGNYAQGAFDVVVSDRMMFPRGHSDKLLVSAEDRTREHVDTNCMAFAKSAAFLIPSWAMMPQTLSAFGDRIMLGLIRYHDLRMVWTERSTVLYESHYAQTYRDAGLPVPHDVHDPDFARAQAQAQHSEEETWARLRMRVAIQAGPPEPISSAYAVPSGHPANAEALATAGRS